MMVALLWGTYGFWTWRPKPRSRVDYRKIHALEKALGFEPTRPELDLVADLIRAQYAPPVHYTDREAARAVIAAKQRKETA